MRLLSLAALVALSTLTCMHTAASQPALDCRVEPRAPTGIRFVLTNPSQAPVWVLKWNTPLEGWRGSIFTVTGPDGTELPYTGPMVKRGDPGRDEYVQIPPGGEVDAVVDLVNVYDLSKPGRYRMQVTGDIADLAADAASVPRPREQHHGVELQCGEITLELARE
jgi:hypothetical protein